MHQIVGKIKQFCPEFDISQVCVLMNSAKSDPSLSAYILEETFLATILRAHFFSKMDSWFPKVFNTVSCYSYGWLGEIHEIHWKCTFIRERSNCNTGRCYKVGTSVWNRNRRLWMKKKKLYSKKGRNRIFGHHIHKIVDPFDSYVMLFVLTTKKLLILVCIKRCIEMQPQQC